MLDTLLVATGVFTQREVRAADRDTDVAIPHPLSLGEGFRQKPFPILGSHTQQVVAGGAGACKDNGFTLVYQLAQKLKAAVGGTREAFERGFITKSQQIGQTGKAIAPKLYIAVGVSGANQHLAGIKNSGKIIAINNDKNAPIFENADVGIVGDLFEIIPELIDELDK